VGFGVVVAEDESGVEIGEPRNDTRGHRAGREQPFCTNYNHVASKGS
jgi:hypothetical protein